MGSADHSITTIVARRLPRNESWLNEAPCAGQWYLTDLPSDVMRFTRRSHVVAAMQPALALCRSCPFTAQCLERVEPRASYFDGVAGGLVFRNGESIGGLTGVIKGRAA